MGNSSGIKNKWEKFNNVYMRVWSSLSIDNMAPKVHEMAMFRKKNLHLSYLYDLYRYYILLLTMNGQVEYTWTIQ